MNKGLIQKLLPHFIAVAVFVLIAVIYCRPTLQGQVLHQEDVVQWEAMAKNQFDYKEKHGHFPLWTNGMFSGMPGYQIAMEPDVPVTPMWFFGIATLFLPKPIAFFFLACICFYFLTQVLRINPYIGIFGALAYAYATYNPIIIVVGHETKMWSIGLMPAVIASVLLIYDRKYLWGAALTALFTALLISMNHLQIVYYTVMIIVAMTIAFAIRWIRNKEVKHLVMAGSFALVAGTVGVLCNAVQILTTLDAAKTTIRGGSELAEKNSPSDKGGLSADYALSYSMFKSEPFVMMVPNMYGGSGSLIEEKIDEEKSETLKALQSMPQEISSQIGGARLAYWGGIGQSTSGPPYVGAIICFLTLIGFFILNSKHKWWILGLTALTILMSWGEYFKGFNLFLLDVLPGYNKFRAPSMIIVIPTLLFCMMAVLTMQAIVASEKGEELWKRYKKGLILTAAVFVVLLMIYFSADFKSAIDRNISQNLSQAPDQVKDYVNQFLKGLQDDRKSLFMSSLGRTFLFIAIAALLLWLSIRKRMQGWWLFAIIGVLSFADVMAVNVKYLNTENYRDKGEVEASLQQTRADQSIKTDTSFYRVLDLRQGVSNALTYGARPTSYFHKSIGGYHPAKLSIYQDLIEKQLAREGLEQQFYMDPGSNRIVNMLNTKYIILPGQTGDTAIQNPGNLGAAWFVNTVKYESTPLAVMNALSTFNPKDTAVLFAADQSKVAAGAPAAGDSIWLVNNDNDVVTYRYNSSGNRFAVFSEVFYDLGWKAYVDNKELPVLRTNYVLRGISLPTGQNKEIRFEFKPKSFYGGETVALVAGIVVMLLLLAAVFQAFRESRQPKAVA